MRSLRVGTSLLRLSTAQSRELGEELRLVRHRMKLSSKQVAESLGWSQAKLSKLEGGSRGTSPWEIGALLGCCGADKPTRDRILAIATESDTGSFLRVHNGQPDTLVALTLHERMAHTITTYEPLVVPSLAQTEEYAYALTGNRLTVAARMARQEALRAPDGPTTALYIHEAALHNSIAGPEVMRDQMLHLTLMCSWTRKTPRLIPMTARSLPAVKDPGTLMSFTDPIKPLAYIETDMATVFHDTSDDVAAYASKMHQLDQLALTAELSSKVFTYRANNYECELHA
ncbi:helix-turn-helix domain-containing protein [Umezawaea beigongshangensis]|uniref:helix-turn-helix domain-containing protein n=1 Tax=Umezawaea beigongshangensis TaxID=2780383 RepID=UPI0018F157C6|nr:helix-turn-helix transcriptional regulator [Umezawaea beigongshangensis]